MTKQEFYLKLEENGISLTQNMKNQFEMYYQMLYKYNQVMDLTNVIEEEQVYERHFYDSICIAFNKDFNNKTLCDVGSGAGFPALPLKIVFPKMKLVIVDSLNKRMNFLKEVINELKLEDITIDIGRVEEKADKYREHFDYVTARAVARLNILLELCIPLVKVNGTFISLKGIQGPTELEESKNALKALDVTLNQTITKEQGYNYYFVKQSKTNKKYPRMYSQIKNKPL